MDAAEGAVEVDGADDDCAQTGKFRRPAIPPRRIAASEQAITRMKILEQTIARWVFLVPMILYAR